MTGLAIVAEPHRLDVGHRRPARQSGRPLPSHPRPYFLADLVVAPELSEEDPALLSPSDGFVVVPQALRSGKLVQQLPSRIETAEASDALPYLVAILDVVESAHPSDN